MWSCALVTHVCTNIHVCTFLVCKQQWYSCCNTSLEPRPRGRGEMFPSFHAAWVRGYHNIWCLLCCRRLGEKVLWPILVALLPVLLMLTGDRWTSSSTRNWWRRRRAVWSTNRCWLAELCLAAHAHILSCTHTHKLVLTQVSLIQIGIRVKDPV